MTSNQEHINALSAQLDKGTGEIKSEIQALKDSAANGEPLDFSALDSKVQGLDDLNADAPAPSEPTEPAPVEEGSADEQPQG